ncbi:MAG: ABC transporter permease [Candidatus Nephthysia bennettiae]|uniref:ABC transporter permease n=1 Tax=Candidatus Nephthysia bennettiae TaxID=3127016 RepID=A0A934K9H4_9BACT|nr:ABC transporter permease [Candidatus Dormibacteraeota bacterium]MBJ7612638.1 ABC transporter permease [Candidatus Dormibacteraeota bacterium]PZR97417.1 MAG: ABC transporter permease [Candidatus Dormibacteraeota bacterium]
MAVQVTTRLGILLLSLWAASVLVFAVVNVLPGDPAAVVLGTNATPESLRLLRQQMGLDQPGWERYLAWVGGMLHGDFGTSLLSRSPVAPEILDKLAVSAPLAALASAVALLLALPLGVLAGVRHRRLSGSLISALSLGGIAVPAFWFGLLMVTLFAIKLRLLPAGGFVPWSDDPLAALRSLLLPALSLGIVQAAVLTRYVRSAVIEVQREDYMRTARAKGLTRAQALRRHGLRNAAIPVVTVLGIQLTSLLVGAIVIENVFVLPGLGRLLFQAVGNRDLVLVQDLVVLLTSLVLVVNFVVDLSYRLIDPRIRASA